MSQPAGASNPFSTRFTRPGAIPYLFPAQEDGERLVAKLQAHGWRGEIIGPHGSGKSTLLATLHFWLAQAGRRPVQITLHDRERSWQAHRSVVAGLRAPDLLIVDGYEQLSSWNRWRLRRLCRRRNVGLLVTAHRPTGLPTLATTAVDWDTAKRVFDHLMPTPDGVDATDLRRALDKAQGNLREALFDLYDVYEARRHPEL